MMRYFHSQCVSPPLKTETVTDVGSLGLNRPPVDALGAATQTVGPHFYNVSCLVLKIVVCNIDLFFY